MWAILTKFIGVAATAALKQFVEGILAWWRERQARKDLLALGAAEQTEAERKAADEAKARMDAAPPVGERDLNDRLRDPNRDF